MIFDFEIELHCNGIVTYVFFSSDETWVLDAINTLSAQRSLHVLLETNWIFAELSSSFVVKWVIGVRFKKEENKAVNDIANIKNRFPVSSQNVQADSAFSINVRMIDWSVAVSNGWLMRIFLRVCHREIILSAKPY